MEELLLPGFRVGACLHRWGGHTSYILIPQAVGLRPKLWQQARWVDDRRYPTPFKGSNFIGPPPGRDSDGGNQTAAADRVFVSTRHLTTHQDASLCRRQVSLHDASLRDVGRISADHDAPLFWSKLWYIQNGPSFLWFSILPLETHHAAWKPPQDACIGQIHKNTSNLILWKHFLNVFQTPWAFGLCGLWDFSRRTNELPCLLAECRPRRCESLQPLAASANRGMWGRPKVIRMDTDKDLGSVVPCSCFGRPSITWVVLTQVFVDAFESISIIWTQKSPPVCDVLAWVRPLCVIVGYSEVQLAHPKWQFSDLNVL